jgi:hypothetical protein
MKTKTSVIPQQPVEDLICTVRCVRGNSSGNALILTFSPREKVEQAHGSGFANEHPANPVACFCGGTVNDAASPGGEGWGEDDSRRILSHARTVHGQRVMLDSDLAQVYGVPTTRLNEADRRDLERFPTDFVF